MTALTGDPLHSQHDPNNIFLAHKMDNDKKFRIDNTDLN